MAYNSDLFGPPKPVGYQTAPNRISGNGDNELLAAAQPKGDDPLATACLGVATVINNALITHPCTVLRRQCQVHQFARKQHLTPITLLPVVVHMVGKDGIYTLWKGSLGNGVLWALSRVTEIVIADAFGLPRYIIPNGSSQKYWRHIYLKAATFAVSTPFIVASFIETVRSSIGFGYEDARVFDVIYNGFDRVKQDLFGAVDTSRRIGVQYLIAPTMGYYTLQFMIKDSLYNNIYSMARRYVGKKPVHERTRFHMIMPELFAGMSSLALTDLICYPLETVLHRLYIQGTRTLIDNLDTGASAISVTVKYTGILDCLKSIIEKEGFWALYSGVGAVALQYGLHFCVLRTMHMIFEHANKILNGGPAPPGYNSTSPVGMNAPSAQFAAASGPSSLEELSRPSTQPFPSFAQTSQAAENVPWNVNTSVRSLPSEPLFPSPRHDPVSF
ncbi:unnamed protein product [Bursaphelenchus xylophilus]|uniref:(pine wood nematode) hypothetical protein n=1 Tax=Bursaphelenchus xylophilus TaxID=6326 RepID=A0A1I7SAE0_BURXY|nr:unnamed protein product [Bursaphelenchus xylophilus]CAG9084014.1 unnamed protein product [Bursaphelenchus xylophilus]